MSRSIEREKLVLVAAGLALAAALAGVGTLLLGRGRGAGGPLAGAPGGASAAASAGASSGAGASILDTASRLPVARKPLLATRGLGAGAGLGPNGQPEASAGKRPTLEEAIGELRAALASDDPDRLGFAEAKLRSFLSGDEGRALALVELFKTETNPAILAMIAGVLAADGTAAASPAVAAAMAAVAEDPRASPVQREQALALLAQSSGAVPDLERRLQALARSDDPAFRQAALAALASRAHALPSAEGGRAAMTALLESVRAERDPDIRAAFLAGVPLRDAPESAVRDVMGAMRGDPAAGVREAAAHALGDVPARERPGAISALEEAFKAESDPGARRAMLISLVRIAGPGASAPIGRLRPVAGATQVDCDDYLAILATGETQADRVFELKVAREIARGGPTVDGHAHED